MNNKFTALITTLFALFMLVGCATNEKTMIMPHLKKVNLALF
jgi:uncharacterized lipoprotein YajG